MGRIDFVVCSATTLFFPGLCVQTDAAGGFLLSPFSIFKQCVGQDNYKAHSFAVAGSSAVYEVFLSYPHCSAFYNYILP